MCVCVWMSGCLCGCVWYVGGCVLYVGGCGCACVRACMTVATASMHV